MKSKSISVANLLGVALVILKLCHVVGWSWYWVTCPFWGPAAILIVILILCALMAGACDIALKFLDK